MPGTCFSGQMSLMSPVAPVLGPGPVQPEGHAHMCRAPALAAPQALLSRRSRRQGRLRALHICMTQLGHQDSTRGLRAGRAEKGS